MFWYLLYVLHLFYPLGLLSFCFFKKVSKIRQWFERVFSKARSNSWFSKISRRNEEKVFENNYVPLPPDDFYLKSKLHNILRNPSQYFANAQIINFDITYHDLHQEKMDHSLKHHQAIFKENFDNFDEYAKDYLVTNTRRAQRNDIFFEKNLFSKTSELLLKKDPHIFLFGMKKKFYYKKLKIMTTDDTKLNF